MEIRRDNYLKKLISKKHNGLIKVITGMRRCGKSYLLFTIFRNYLLETGVPEDHIIDMAFDSYENKKYRDPDVLYPHIKNQISDHGMYYILLDEVQLLGDFESVLNGFMRMPNVDVYVTGSNAKFLSKDIITEFRGRGDELHMSPLSFREFMSVYDGNKYDGWNEYVLYGGLPLTVLLPTAEQKIEFLKRLFDETYINDIVGRHRIRNKDEFEELINILSSSIGSLTNPKKLADTFKPKKGKKISVNTITNYLDYLCDAFVVSRATRYDIKGKKYIDTPQKYYFSDVGLRNARINFRQIEENHTMENILYDDCSQEISMSMLDSLWFPEKTVMANWCVNSWKWILSATRAPSDITSNLHSRSLTKPKCSRNPTLCGGLMIRSRRSSWSRILRLPGIPRRASW